MSIRDSVIEFIKKEMDKAQSETKDVQNLLNALESDKLQRADIGVNENDPSSGLVIQEPPVELTMAPPLIRK